jgi:methylmalonyl-CoA epimerase
MSPISHIDHIAIVVLSIDQVRSFYEQALGLAITNTEEMPERGIKVAFITIGQTKIELIEPLHENSEVSKFLQTRGPGLHHIALKTADIKATETNLQKNHARLLYEQAKPGAHETMVNFVHPKSTGGALVEIVE